MRMTNTITKEMVKEKEVIIYGAGCCGEIASLCLKKWGNCRQIYYCDANEKKRIEKEGEILSPRELAEHMDAVIILASLNYFYEMLNECKKRRNYNYFDMEEMFYEDLSIEELSYQAQDVFANKSRYIDMINHSPNENRICISKVEITVTEACSLKCQDCSYLMPYYSHPKNREWEKLCCDIDRLLSVVDRISELRLLGGEPILNKDLWRLIERYAENEKIGMLDIHTNGTIIPDDITLNALQKKKVVVHISDYQVSTNKVIILKERFEERGIRYFVRKYDTWNKMGLMKDHHYTEKELKDIFNNCTSRNCFVVKDGRFYRCARSAHSTSLGMIPDFPKDYLTIDGTLTKDKMQEFIASTRPISACGFCVGGWQGVEKVPAAIQVEGGKRD